LKQLAFVSALTTPSQHRLLDVGAGLAHFVNVAADNGFDAIGVEPSYQVSQGFQPRNASLLPGSVNDLPADQLFDVITLWDVIEHVEKPLEIIQQSIAHLRPGGWLVLETGNYQSTSRIMSGDSWWAYHVEHRWYFTPSSLELTMKHAGLENFRHGQVGAPPRTGLSSLQWTRQGGTIEEGRETSLDHRARVEPVQPTETGCP
jgi:SAM-dependent methyltransferase